MPYYKMDFYLNIHKGTTVEAKDPQEAYEKAVAELKIKKEDIEDIGVTEVNKEGKDVNEIL